MKRLAVVLVSLAAITALLTGGAVARPRTTEIIHDGFWGGLETAGATVDYTYLTLHDRMVTKLRFGMLLDCESRTSHQHFQRFFMAGKAFPRGLRIPARGRLDTVNWSETDANREGQITGELDWSGRHPLASFSVTVLGSALHPEDCTGFAAIRLFTKHSLSALPPGITIPTYHPPHS
jgi:hypothetical protein